MAAASPDLEKQGFFSRSFLLIGNTANSRKMLQKEIFCNLK
jgi:hypothetical protein